MRSHARRLCDQHGYPEQLAEILEEVVSLALAHLGDVCSVVLSPSASTGDFLWKRIDSEVHLLSDVDGFVFMNGDAKDRAGFFSAVHGLSEQIGGPMFHVDLSVSDAGALDHLPRSYQFVETGIAGFVLYGEPVLTRFPRQFDPRASRQAFLLNLFKPLRHAFVDPDPDGAAQAVARLILDIPILALSERGECIAGHRARARWFLDDRPTPLGCDEAIRAAVSAAYAAREDPPGDVAMLGPLLHAAIPRVVGLLDGRGDPGGDPDRTMVERLATWLPPRAARRVLAECRTLVKRPTNPVADLGWLVRRKEASAGAALLGLLHYVARGAVGAPPEGIRARLHEFSRRECSRASGLAFVQSACEVYLEGLLELYPSLREPGEAPG
jgi:hypothetical protein